MPAISTKRSTIYFDPELHRALRVMAATMDATISDVVNDDVRRTLAEDASDLEAFREREGESTIEFEDLVRDLKRRGRL